MNITPAEAFHITHKKIMECPDAQLSIFVINEIFFLPFPLGFEIKAMTVDEGKEIWGKEI